MQPKVALLLAFDALLVFTGVGTARRTGTVALVIVHSGLGGKATAAVATPSGRVVALVVFHHRGTVLAFKRTSLVRALENAFAVMQLDVQVQLVAGREVAATSLAAPLGQGAMAFASVVGEIGSKWDENGTMRPKFQRFFTPTATQQQTCP